jgi:glutathione S-transferase
MAEARQALLPAAATSRPKVTLLALSGSHFVMKVMAAMAFKGVRYDLRLIHPLRLQKDLKPPHTVPVLLWGEEYIPDSTRILHFLDEQFPETSLYPEPVVKSVFQSVPEAEKWMSDVLYEWCMYWQWLDWEGYSRSLRISLGAWCFQRYCMLAWFEADLCRSPSGS